MWLHCKHLKMFFTIANFIFTVFKNNMNIQSKAYQPTFTARSPEVRYADKIMRNLMLEYPAFSSSRVKFYDCYQKQRPKVFKKVLPIYWKLHAERNGLSKYQGIDLINATLEMVKRDKNANCAEYATMARAAFLANGYKDVRLGSLRINYPKEGASPMTTSEKVDHRVLIVNAGKDAKLDDPNTFSKKAIIVDPWGGFCDYVSNAFNTYKGIFLKHLKPEKENVIKKFIFEECKSMNITLKTCSSIGKKHPELIVK